MPNALPPWYSPEQPDAGSAAGGKLPGWYKAEPPDVADPASEGSAYENLKASVARIPGAVLGAPHFLSQLASSVAAQGINSLSFDHTHLTGADVDKYNPVSQVTPPADLINKGNFADLKALGAPVTDYQPKTTGGELGSAFVTGAGAGLLDPAADYSAAKGMGSAALQALKAATKTGAASSAAEGVHMAAPNSDILPVIAAIAAHGGLSTAEHLGTATGRSATSDIVQPFLNPKAAGDRLAGVTLEGTPFADVKNPTAASLANDAANVRAKTDALGAGSIPANAMGGLRDYLTGLKGNLQDTRDMMAKPFYDRFRDQPSLAPNEVAPLFSRPAVHPASKGAADDIRNLGAEPFSWRPSSVSPTGTLAFKRDAFTPDLLDRTATKLSSSAASLRQTPDAQAAAASTAASQHVRNFLDDKYPTTYPQARAMYERASAPLQPFAEQNVASVMKEQRDAQGRPLGHTVPDEALFDRIVGSKAPGAVVKSFIDAAGDKKAVLPAMEEAIVGHLRNKGAIDASTGELNARVYDKEIAPYMPTISMYLPQLKAKFGTAGLAQRFLDTARAQDEVAGNIRSGALRDSGDTSGVVTQGSFDRWLMRNEKSLAKTQGKDTLSSLRTIRDALPKSPLSLTEASADLAPTATAAAIGGSEFGVLTNLVHGFWSNTLGKRVKGFGDYYSKAIERSLVDPVYRKELVDAVRNKPRGLSDKAAMAKAIATDFRSLATQTPLAASSAQAVSARSQR